LARSLRRYRCEPAELGVNQRHQGTEGVGVADRPAFEQLRDVADLILRHERLHYLPSPHQCSSSHETECAPIPPGTPGRRSRAPAEDVMRRKALGCLLVGLAAMAMSGCLLRFTLGMRLAETLSEEIELIVDAIRTEATTAVCQTDPFFSPFFQRCTYFINGVEVASTTSLLRELGPFGAMIDPIVLELPARASIAGTFTGGGLSGNLLVYPNLSFVPIDDTRTFTPGPGKQLAIVDLPPTAPVDGVTYEFELTLRQTLPRGSAPTQVKALMTGRARNGGKTYYPPFLPCVTNMSAVPTLQLATSAALQPLSLAGSPTPCNNATYTYFRPSLACDLDNDTDVDTADVNLIMIQRNKTASAGDPRDVTGDLLINANDARFCTQRCTRPKCATTTVTTRRRAS
jgi:hypothetical protein